jgi:hypothetical protein
VIYDDDVKYAVAQAIFKVDQDYADAQQNPLPDRHFKVAISLYLAQAQGALDTLRELELLDERVVKEILQGGTKQVAR